MPDLSIKCPRCSRAQKKEVLAHYRFKTTKKQAPSIPEKLFCQNLECMALIGSLALPYTLRNQTSHIEIMCHACKEISHVQLLNIVEVE
jgi:phage FluMu protein Com